jgi:hypothetical protein
MARSSENQGTLRWLPARTSALLAACVLAGGCVRYHPAPIDAATLGAGALTQEHDGIRVSVVVPDDAEAERLFGVPLAKYGIQPVGFAIANDSETFFWFSHLGVDPDYFTPIEAANRARYFLPGSANEEMRQHFLDNAIGSYVGPGQQIDGFLFTTLNRGLKPVNVDLVGPDRMVSFYFTIRVANLDTEYSEADVETLYAPDQIHDVSESQLRSAIEAMPCCATTADAHGLEDPLNFVFVGDTEDVLGSLVSTGWHVSEVLKPRTALETLRSYFFSGHYEYAPISPLYLFGRREDLALQRARETARERNHLRVWRTALRCGGKPVWIGQISRDIGLTFSWKTFIGHEVDPDVDEARNYLAQDMLRSQGVERFGWAKGVGTVSADEPRLMTDGSPFFTDGLRLVLWFSKESIPLDEIDLLLWERLPPR